MKHKRCYGVLFVGITSDPPIKQCSAVGISRGGLCFACTQRKNVGFWAAHIKPAFYADRVGPPPDRPTERLSAPSTDRPLQPRPSTVKPVKPAKSVKPRGSVWMSRKDAQRIIHGGG